MSKLSRTMLVVYVQCQGNFNIVHLVCRMLGARGGLCQLSSSRVLNATYKSWAMFKLHWQGGELCQNCPRQGWWAMFKLHRQGGELCQNCPGKAGGLCSNYTSKAVSYVKIVPARLAGYVQITPARWLVGYVQITPARR